MGFRARLTLLTCTLAALAAPACVRSTDPLPEPGEGVFVTGVVVARDLETAETIPLPGARVQVIGTSVSAATDARGFFQLARIPLGRFRVAIEVRDALGAITAARRLEPVEGLVDGQSIDVGTVEMVGTGGVSGLVLAEPGDVLPVPARGALVVVAETAFQAIAGEDGRYVIPGLPEGKVDVVAFQSGYLAARRVGVSVGAGRREMLEDLHLVRAPSEVAVELRGRARLIGRADSSGIQVRLRDQQDPSLVLSATTAADGSFRVRAPLGVYRGRFFFPGYVPVDAPGIAVLQEGVLGLGPVELLPEGVGDRDGDGTPDDRDPDRDGDGCANEIDRFPDDVLGCGDADADGLADEVEVDDDADGLSDAEEVSAGADGWSTNPLRVDTDGDAIADASDTCPTVSDPEQRDTDGDGAGDACDVSESGGPGLPSITRVAPLRGAPGTAVTLSGFNFGRRGDVAVRFGPEGSPGFVREFLVVADRSMTVRVPADAESGPVTVLNASGSATSTSTFLVESPPEIVEFEPAAARVQGRLSVYGRRFGRAGFVVRIGGQIAPELGRGQVRSGVEVLDLVQVAVPPGVVFDRARTAEVSVTDGVGARTADARLIVLAGPRIESIAPNPARVGLTLALSGSGFATDDLAASGPVEVLFPGVAEPVAPTRVSDTVLRVVVPEGAMDGPLTLRHPAGDFVAAQIPFILDRAAPYVSELEPRLATAGELVTLRGGNLNAVTAVRFGGGAGAPIAPEAVSDREVRVVVPADASPGLLELEVAGVSPPPRSPAPLRILARTAETETGRYEGLGFSNDGQRVHLVDGRTGFTLDATTLTPVGTPVELDIPALRASDRFVVAPSGLRGLVTDASTLPAMTYILDLPSFSVLGTCETVPGTPFDYVFDPQSRFAYAPTGTSLGGGAETGVLRVDLEAGTCGVIGVTESVPPFTSVAALGADELYVASDAGLGVLSVRPGSPLYGRFTTPIAGPPLASVQLFPRPGAREVYTTGVVLSLYPLGSAAAPVALGPFDPTRPFQSDDLQWLIGGVYWWNLAEARLERVASNDVSNAAGAMRSGVLIVQRNFDGLIRFEIRE